MEWLLLSVFMLLRSIKFCSWLISHPRSRVLFRALAHLAKPWHLGQPVTGTSGGAILTFPIITACYLVKSRSSFSHFREVLCRWKELLQLLRALLVLCRALQLCRRSQSLLQHSVTFGHINPYIRSAFLVCSTQAQAILGWHFPTRPEGVRCLN